MSEAAIKQKDEPFFFRPYKEDDLNFIQSSWGYAYYDNLRFKRFIAPAEFHFHHRPIRDKILKNKDVAIIICAAKIDPDTILGYAIVEKLNKANAMVLHFVYVKENFRREGIANDLLEKCCQTPTIFMSHLTIPAIKIIKNNPSKFQDWYYYPHLI